MLLFRAARRRDFTLLVLARTISRLGDAVHEVALAWLVLELTGSAAAMGVVLTAQLIPTLVLLLLGGAVADRWPKLPLMIGSDGLRAAVVVLVALLVAANAVALPHLIVLGVVFGLVDAVFMPAWAALLPEIVPAEDRASANALATLTARLAGIVGPVVGAGLVALGGTALAFAVDGASFVVSGLLLVWLAAGRRRAAATEPALDQAAAAQRELRADVREGFATVLATPWIAIGIAAAGVTNITLAGPLEAAVPLLIQRSLHADVDVFGLYGSCLAGGAVVAAIALGSRARLRRRWRLVYGPWVALALACAAMGLPIGVPGLLIAGAIVGFGESALGLAWTNALQDHVPSDRLGRVYSLDYLGSAGLIPIGYLAAGAASDIVGPSLVFLVGGLVSAAILAALTALPQVRAMD